MSNAASTASPTRRPNDEAEIEEVNEVIRMWAQQRPQQTQNAIDHARRTDNTEALRRFREAGVL